MREKPSPFLPLEEGGDPLEEAQKNARGLAKRIILDFAGLGNEEIANEEITFETDIACMLDDGRKLHVRMKNIPGAIDREYLSTLHITLTPTRPDQFGYDAEATGGSGGELARLQIYLGGTDFVTQSVTPYVFRFEESQCLSIRDLCDRARERFVQNPISEIREEYNDLCAHLFHLQRMETHAWKQYEKLLQLVLDAHDKGYFDKVSDADAPQTVTGEVRDLLALSETEKKDDKGPEGKTGYYLDAEKLFAHIRGMKGVWNSTKQAVINYFRDESCIDPNDGLIDEVHNRRMARVLGAELVDHEGLSNISMEIAHNNNLWVTLSDGKRQE